MSKHLVELKVSDTLEETTIFIEFMDGKYPLQPHSAYHLNPDDLEAALREHMHHKTLCNNIVNMEKKIAELKTQVNELLTDNARGISSLMQDKTEKIRVLEDENERLKAQTTSTESKCKQCTMEDLCKSLAGENLLGRRNCTAFIPKLTRTRRIDGETRTYDVTTQEGINAYTMDMIKMLNERVNECARKQKEPDKQCLTCAHFGKGVLKCFHCQDFVCWEKA